jgi:hypothetical protein
VPQAKGAPACGRDLRNQRVLLHKFAKPAIPLNVISLMSYNADYDKKKITEGLA